MFCNKCGNEVKNGDTFCKKCGEKIEGMQSSNIKGKESIVKIKLIYLLIPIILVIILLGVMLFRKSEPKNYEDIIDSFAEAMVSEKKMGNFIEEHCDVKGIIAWQEADGEAEDFKKEYKEIDDSLSSETDDIKDSLEGLALENEFDEFEIKVVDIDEPEQDEDNKKIYYISATFKSRIKDSRYNSSWEKEEVEFIFYKNKIVDITSEGYSLFSEID